MEFETFTKFDTTTEMWTATSIANAPLARYGHTAVWTGSEMIVWGGQGASHPVLNTGGRYCGEYPPPTPTPSPTPTIVVTNTNDSGSPFVLAPVAGVSVTAGFASRRPHAALCVSVPPCLCVKPLPLSTPLPDLDQFEALLPILQQLLHPRRVRDQHPRPGR